MRVLTVCHARREEVALARAVRVVGRGGQQGGRHDAALCGGRVGELPRLADPERARVVGVVVLEGGGVPAEVVVEPVAGHGPRGAVGRIPHLRDGRARALVEADVGGGPGVVGRPAAPGDVLVAGVAQILGIFDVGVAEVVEARPPAPVHRVIAGHEDERLGHADDHGVRGDVHDVHPRAGEVERLCGGAGGGGAPVIGEVRVCLDLRRAVRGLAGRIGRSGGDTCDGGHGPGQPLRDAPA